jgi:hypothetical protein
MTINRVESPIFEAGIAVALCITVCADKYRKISLQFLFQ